ncbi:MAG TPA: DUF6416 domain-containing protein [Solirubrobacteraceae bacterium]|nr:DUF6416 domain-containing protein [Solirubrobacteraceae bacterium]
MADKQITVAVPEERVPEFYLWFAHFLSAPAGSEPPRHVRGGFGHGPRSRRHGPPGFGRPERSAWTSDDVEEARWLYSRLSDPARELFDLLIDDPGARHAGNELASRLRLDKGAHGVVGILAWPGRWCSKLGREFPITTQAREDGGTDYSMSPELAELFGRARASANVPRGHR